MNTPADDLGVLDPVEAESGPSVEPADAIPAEDPSARHLREVVARALRIFEHGPRDDDYLPIPDRSRQDMDWHIAGIKERTGFVVNDADRLWMYVNQTLYDLYGERRVITYRTGRGVVVLAAGSDEIKALSDAIPLSERAGATLE